MGILGKLLGRQTKHEKQTANRSSREGSPLTYELVDDDLQGSGYVFVPSCDNPKWQGQCVSSPSGQYLAAWEYGEGPRTPGKWLLIDHVQRRLLAQGSVYGHCKVVVSNAGTLLMADEKTLFMFDYATKKPRVLKKFEARIRDMSLSPTAKAAVCYVLGYWPGGEVKEPEGFVEDRLWFFPLDSDEPPAFVESEGAPLDTFSWGESDRSVEFETDKDPLAYAYQDGQLIRLSRNKKHSP